MKVDEKSGAQVDGRLRLAKSVPRKEATTGGLVQSSTVRSDRVSITADGLVASIESEMAAERKAKIAEISELVNKKTFFPFQIFFSNFFFYSSKKLFFY
jgi:hypothetical protein